MRNRRRCLFFVALFIAATLSTFAQYQLGPRGGCYTLSKSGNKRYVDRSMCAAPETKPKVVASRSLAGSTSAKPSGFIRGPRGGCYTLSASGDKKYVAREMCD